MATGLQPATGNKLRILVDAAGVEPAVPGAADLQSTGVTNFPTHPKMVLDRGIEPLLPT